MARSDREIRKLVAQLHAMRPRDSEAVLKLLSERQRERLARLIESLPSPAPAPVEAAAVLRPPDGLSEWLVKRLDHSATGSATPHALAALRACAEAMNQQPPGATAAARAFGAGRP